MGLSPPSSFYMHAFILLWCFCLFLTSVTSGNNVTDQLALLEFKAKITHDPFGIMSSWNDSIHFCQWQGVTCGRRHQRVTVLNLQSQKLVGPISPFVGNLSFLRNLTLQNNNFHSEIPPEIGCLRKLQVLRLDNNTISGIIHSNLSSCTNLIEFNVGFNYLVGEIPAKFATLSKLQIFAIPKNNLTGSIPLSFGNLSFLKGFSATYNHLGGIIPHSFGQLTKLTLFAVGSNRLFGTIPPSIYNLSSLTQFDIGDNQIQGRLPSNIGITLPKIEFFSISRNQFTGFIPVSISNASNLNTIYLGINQLTGKVPSLEKLYKMRRFLITLNFLGNEEANDLSFLYNNQIFGYIPAGIGNLINLERLEMWNNKLSGNIPFEIGKPHKLQFLDLSQNNFSGNIPSSLGNFTNLIELYLQENNLQGNIPSSLGQCQNLIYLFLDHNILSGSISPQVIGLSFSPISLDISANQFTGTLPMEVGNFKNLGYLDISENMLSGKIPMSLGSCVKLEFLAMRRNFFQGTIPSSFESLRGLKQLDLSSNNFSGEIPKFLELFDLQLLNLSNNHFEGEVPTKGIFKNTSATSLNGNGELCGGIPKFQLPKCKYNKSKKKKLTLIVKLIISILSGLFGVTLILSLLLLCSLRKKRKKNTSIDSINFLLNVSYQSLLNATNGFSSANLIGKGSFGSVYKGILDQGRHMVAVKVLNLSHRGASKSFMAECEALRNIRHRNLVKVLIACSSIDYQGHDFKALVYEFLRNGNLDEWLHPTPRTNEATEEPRKLSILQRLNIAIDVASALDYLHHHCETPIVHCDLKPSNVLLDDDLIGHVSDFGLARFLQDVSQDCSANQSSSIGVRGTIGYTPPEYGMGNEVSLYGDTYSYGILLLEMFIGKRPTDSIFQDNSNLHDFVKAALSERKIHIIDPNFLWERISKRKDEHQYCCS
uniref:non-specific serine/threonine protein kinase n=1 Tax=Quercus lobata TaxID=97700 RepID=A0A7N2LD49_QUELO